MPDFDVNIRTTGDTSGAYRWLRILQNGVSGGVGDNLFFINEWEFYGTLNN